MDRIGLALMFAGLVVMVYGAVRVGRPDRCRRCGVRIPIAQLHVSQAGEAFLCSQCGAADSAYWQDLFAERIGHRVEKPRDSYTDGFGGGAAAS